MTVVLVLGVISITLALSYAMLRSQVTSVAIQSNLNRRASARQAAYAGVSVALNKMHRADWASQGGVGMTLLQETGESQWFEISYEVGDANLKPTDEDYDEYPFRVTIHSIGYAADPDQPHLRSSYGVRAVVQLVRRKLNDAPAGWQNTLGRTIHQWSAGTLPVEFPVSVEGPVMLQGTMVVSSDYPADLASRDRYHADLNAIRLAGLGDFRPFSGPILTPTNRQSSSTLSLLQDRLGVALQNTAISTTAPFSYPTTATSYQLYPGGKSYTMPVLQATYGSTLSGVTLQPDPIHNPLGVFLSNGLLTLGNNVTVRGTILTQGTSEPDISISGTNVQLLASALPAIEGSSQQYQLPVAIIRDDFLLQGTGGATIRGTVAVWDEFAFLRADTAAACDLEGRVVCSRLTLNGRIPWDLSQLAWELELLDFLSKKDSSNALQHRFFPYWMQNKRNMVVKPALTIRPASADIVSHWHPWGQPVYVPLASDTGLRWNLIAWSDHPQ